MVYLPSCNTFKSNIKYRKFYSHLLNFKMQLYQFFIIIDIDFEEMNEPTQQIFNLIGGNLRFIYQVDSSDLKLGKKAHIHIVYLLCVNIYLMTWRIKKKSTLNHLNLCLHKYL